MWIFYWFFSVKEEGSLYSCHNDFYTFYYRYKLFIKLVKLYLSLSVDDWTKKGVYIFILNINVKNYIQITSTQPSIPTRVLRFLNTLHSKRCRFTHQDGSLRYLDLTFSLHVNREYTTCLRSRFYLCSRGLVSTPSRETLFDCRSKRHRGTFVTFEVLTSPSLLVSNFKNTLFLILSHLLFLLTLDKIFKRKTRLSFDRNILNTKRKILQ